MGKKLLLYLCVFFFSLWNVEAKPRSPFRVENDTVLHVCSTTNSPLRLSQEVRWDSLFGFSTIIVDEGVDSLLFNLPVDSVKHLVLPASLQKLVFYAALSSQCEIRLNPKNPYLCLENGNLYNRAKTQLILSAPNPKESVFQLPETVDSVSYLPLRHFSKVIFPKHLNTIPYDIDCDSLIILSKHWSRELSSFIPYIYCENDSIVAKELRNDLWRTILYDVAEKRTREIHCPNLDKGKRDTSWMRDAYQFWVRVDHRDSWEKVDSIYSTEFIDSVRVEEVPEEALLTFDGEDSCQFYVATYDTLYLLPFVVRSSPYKRGAKPLESIGEVKNSVFIVAEGVDTLPLLQSPTSAFTVPSYPFRKVVLPKSLHYLKGNFSCDSLFIYSDSLRADSCYYADPSDTPWWNIQANYYYVENEQLYLSLKYWLMKNSQTAVVYSPNADVRKRNLKLQEKTYVPIWKDRKGNVLSELSFRPPFYYACPLRLTMDGDDSLRFILSFRRDNGYERLVQQNSDSVWMVPVCDGELRYAVWSYDTLLVLPQKTLVKKVKRDGSLWTDPTSGIDFPCLFYLPKGEKVATFLESGKTIKFWKNGDTIPRRYANRLCMLYRAQDGESACMDGSLVFRLWQKDVRNYLSMEEQAGCNRETNCLDLSHCKEVWLEGITVYFPDCMPYGFRPMHFYIGR